MSQVFYMIKTSVNTTVRILPHPLKPWSAVWFAWEGRVTCVLQAVKGVEVVAACYPHCPVIVKHNVFVNSQTHLKKKKSIVDNEKTGNCLT